MVWKILGIILIYISFIFLLYSCLKAAGDYDRNMERQFEEMKKSDRCEENE